MNELKITKEKVLEAAEKCSEAKKVLEALFPEAFDDGVVLKQQGYDIADVKTNNIVMYIRGGGEYAHKALFLNDVYNWEIKRDSSDDLCLIPTRK